MAATCLREAAHQDRVARLEEDDQWFEPPGGEHGPCPPDRRCRIADPNIEHQGCVSVALGIGVPQRQEGVQKVRWQVVDARVAKVLEQLRRLALSSSGQPA